MGEGREEMRTREDEAEGREGDTGGHMGGRVFLTAESLKNLRSKALWGN